MKEERSLVMFSIGAIFTLIGPICLVLSENKPVSTPVGGIMICLMVIGAIMVYASAWNKNK